MAAAMVLAAAGAMAQSESYSEPSHCGGFMWYGRAGVAINNAALNGDAKNAIDALSGQSGDGLRAKAGYDFAVGFNKYFGRSRAYWGMELGFGTRGFSQKWEHSKSGEILGVEYKGTESITHSYLAHRFKVTPIMVG